MAKKSLSLYNKWSIYNLIISFLVALMLHARHAYEISKWTNQSFFYYFLSSDGKNVATNLHFFGKNYGFSMTTYQLALLNWLEFFLFLQVILLLVYSFNRIIRHHKRRQND